MPDVSVIRWVDAKQRTVQNIINILLKDIAYGKTQIISVVDMI